MSKNNQTYTQLKQSAAKNKRNNQWRVISHNQTINFRRNHTGFQVVAK